MKNLLLISLLFSTVSLFGQGRDLRMEIEIDHPTDQYFVFPTGEAGLITFHATDSIVPKVEDRLWRYEKYTTDFIKIWGGDITVRRGLIFQRQYWDGIMLHTLFMPEKIRNRQPFQIISFNAETGDVRNFEGVIPYRMQLNDFSVIHSFAYLGGETQMGKLETWGRGLATGFVIPIFMGVMNYNPDLVLYRVFFKEDKAREVKFDYYKANAVHSLAPNDPARSMSVVIQHSPKRKLNKVYVKEYAGDKLIKNLEVNPKSHNRLLTAKILHLNRNEFLVMGTYGLPYYDQKIWPRIGSWITRIPLKDQAQGIYVAKFSYRAQEFIKYYNFAEFENFFEAYGYKEKKKIKKKAKRKKKKGKQLVVEVSLLLHEIIEKEDEYVAVAEAYVPVYAQRSRFDPLTGIVITSGRQEFIGYRYTHAMVAGFDKETGEMTWDNSFPIWNIISEKLQQKVQVISEERDSVTTLVYNKEGYLLSRDIVKGEVISNKQVRPIETEFMSERIKSEYNSDIEHWYDNHFLAWGYRKIVDTDKKIFSRDRNKQVFYFYKVSY
jgi:hypothetical protein